MVLAKTPSFVFDSVLEIFSCFLTSSWIVLKSWEFQAFFCRDCSFCMPPGSLIPYWLVLLAICPVDAVGLACAHPWFGRFSSVVGWDGRQIGSFTLENFL